MQQNEIKLNLKQYLPENWEKIAETSNSWPNTFIAPKYRPNPDKIQPKWTQIEIMDLVVTSQKLNENQLKLANFEQKVGQK